MTFGMVPTVRPYPVDDVSIGLGKLVAALAMRLGNVLGLDRIPSQRIHANADGLQVRGINARAISAQMINNEPARDRANSKFVSEPRSSYATTAFVLATPDVEATVAISVEAQQPRPAAMTVGVSSMGAKASLVGE